MAGNTPQTTANILQKIRERSVPVSELDKSKEEQNAFGGMKWHRDAVPAGGLTEGMSLGSRIEVIRESRKLEADADNAARNALNRLGKISSPSDEVVKAIDALRVYQSGLHGLNNVGVSSGGSEIESRDAPSSATSNSI